MKIKKRDKHKHGDLGAPFSNKKFKQESVISAQPTNEIYAAAQFTVIKINGNTYYKGFWNGEAAKIRVVVGIVGDEPAELKKQIESNSKRKRFLWFMTYVGTQQQMVEVIYGGQTFYLSNIDGSGVRKVTLGMGSPGVGHSSIYPTEILHEVPREYWQQYSDEVAQIVKDEVDAYWTDKDPDGWTQSKKDSEAILAMINQ